MWRLDGRQDNFKHEYVHDTWGNRNRADYDPTLYRRCGYCLSCRLHKSYEWSLRGQHEFQMTGRGEFVTLTFDDDHCPPMLDYSIFQKFLKRLRKKASFRFMGCGEYGTETFRPHFHGILFGLSLGDRVAYKKSGDNMLYNSATLSSAWPFGHAVTADVTPDSIAYVSRYTLGKAYGDKAEDRYFLPDAETNFILTDYTPEMMYSSKCPAIGIPWLQKYYSDIYPRGYMLTEEGIKLPPARSYNLWMKKHMPDLFEATQVFSEDYFPLVSSVDRDRLFARDYIVQSLTKADRSFS